MEVVMRKSTLVVVALGATGLASCSPRSVEKRATEVLHTYDVQNPSPQPGAVPADPLPPPMVAPPPVVATSERRADIADHSAGPNVAVSAAPGVAWAYRYAYRLPNARIQAVQEAHAAMCEKLGVARCRITGMHYALVNETDIQANLELKLAPELARAFGKDATRAVGEVKGTLVEQDIRGADMAPTIAGADRGRAAMQDEIDRVTRALSRPGLSNVERERLGEELAQYRAQMRGLAEEKGAAKAALASTPMLLSYGSGTQVPGLDEEHPLFDSLNEAGLTFQRALAVLITLVAALLPWLVVGGLAWLAARRLGWLGRLSAARRAE
jgi:Domain of unknown function (DUF4349)